MNGFHGVALTDRLLLVDLTGYLPDEVLTRVDRSSMAVGLEPRAPYLDRTVFDLAWRMDPTLRVKDGVNKWPLREVLYRHVPRRLVDRPKMGYGPPIGSWLRGVLRPMAEDHLSPGELRRHGVIAPEPVARAWHAHISGRRDLGPQLWAAVALQSWLDRWSRDRAVRVP